MDIQRYDRGILSRARDLGWSNEYYVLKTADGYRYEIAFTYDTNEPGWQTVLFCYPPNALPDYTAVGINYPDMESAIDAVFDKHELEK